MTRSGPDIIAQAAGKGMEKCLARLNGASPGSWRLAALGTSEAGRIPAEPGEAPLAVRVSVSGRPRMTTLLLLAPGDAEHVNRCFVEDGLYAAFGPDRREITLLELGNILLNALINALMNACSMTAVPSVPELIPPEEAAAAGGAAVHARLSAGRDGREAQVLLLAFVPDSGLDDVLKQQQRPDRDEGPQGDALQHRP